MRDAINLATLPRPQVIEELDFEAIVTRQKEKFQELWAAVKASNPELDLPDYNVAMLETDPVTILIEAESYQELMLRARVNDAARANLLAFSAGSDLDHLAADHGVTRLVGERDAGLRERIILKDQGNSAAGPEEWYASHARSVSTDVKDAAVYRPGAGPEVAVAVLSVSNGGVPSPALLNEVLAKVSAPAVRSVNDIVTVVAATSTIVNVTADVWLLPRHRWKSSTGSNRGCVTPMPAKVASVSTSTGTGCLRS